MDVNIQDSLQKSSDYTAGKVQEVTDKVQEVTGNVKKLKEAPRWARSLVLTDWVSLACMAPIIAGLVVYVVYLSQANQDFNQILGLMEATGGFSKWITAYGIFLAVTLPLVVISLCYVLGLLLGECLSKVTVKRDKAAMSGAAIQPKRYRIFRAALLVLMGLKYLGLLWLTAQLVATAILLVAAYGIEGAANSAMSFYTNAYALYSAGLDRVPMVNVSQLSELAYQTSVIVNGVEVTVAQFLDALLLSSTLHANTTTVLSGAKNAINSNEVCPDFCINMSFLKDMLGMEAVDTCICSPEDVAEIASLASGAKGLLVTAIVGIVLMVCAWIIMLMRLAATHDILRVKYMLQDWLIESSDPSTRFNTGMQLLPSVSQDIEDAEHRAASDIEAALPPPSESQPSHWWQ